MSFITRPYDNPFIFTVNTALAGVTPSNQFTLSVDTARNDYDYEVDWGDGVRERYNNNTRKVHVYPSPGIYRIAVRGKFPNPAYNNSNDVTKIISIDSWGKLGLGFNQFNNAFLGAINCTSIPSVGDNFWNSTSLSVSFGFMSLLNRTPVLNTHNVTNVNGLFQACNLTNTNATGLVTLSNGVLSGTNTFFTIELEHNYSIIICGRFFNVLEVIDDNIAIVDDQTTVISVPAAFKLAGISKLNTSSVVTVGAFLQGNPNLSEIPKFNFSNATSMSFSFTGCTSLISIPHFNTSKVTELNFRDSVGSGSLLGSFRLTGIRNVSCSGTVTLSGGVLTGNGTNFISELKLDHDVIINNQWFEVIAINSNTEALVNDTTTIINTPSSIRVAGFPKLDLNVLVRAAGAWQSCSFLQSFPPIDMPLVTDLGLAWQGCSSLTSFPLIDTSSNITFSQSWSGCSSLTSFPLINTSSGTNFSSAWSGCSSLTSFPLLNTSNGTTFSQSWLGCSSLTSFPLLNTSNGIRFDYAWFGCRSLINFPLLNVSNGVNFDYSWNDCRSLTSFPLLNVSKGNSFNSSWKGCSSLTSFPFLDVSNGVNFNAAWASCSSLTSFPRLDFSKATIISNDASGTWSSCNNLSDVLLTGTVELLNGNLIGNGTQFTTQLRLNHDVIINNKWYNVTAILSDTSATVTDTVSVEPAGSSFQLAGFPHINTPLNTNLYGAWSSCSKLTRFPPINTSNVTNFAFAWDRCTSLTSFPFIDTSKGTNFNYTWRSLPLTSFPLLDFSSATTLFNTWVSCTALTSFPLINTSKVTDFSSTWNSCWSLLTFPLIDTSSGTTFINTWRLTKIANFPALNFTKGVSFLGCWQGSSIVSFPSVSFVDATNFNFAWDGCVSMTTFSPNCFNSWVGTPVVNCFLFAWRSCTSLTAQSVENILVSINTSGRNAPAGATGTQADITISYNVATGGLTATTLTAIANLKAKGWKPHINNVYV